MDSEFVNVFIEKQREAISDLTSRNIMLETRITVAEAKLNSVPQLVAEKAGEFNIEREQLQKVIQEQEVQITTLKKAVSDLARAATKISTKVIPEDNTNLT